MIQISLLRSYKRVPHQFRCFRPATTRRYKSTIIDILKPIVVEDDDAVVDGDGSNAYQNKEETRERWEVPRVPVMDISIDGLTPSQIYADWGSPISYYIRMDKDPKDNKNLACFLRHRGPPILPFSEVVYVVHPYLMTHIFSKGTAPEDLSQRNFDRIYSPANLRAVPSNVAALGRLFVRSHVTGDGPNYKNCWARSTAWAHAKYLKIIEKQYDAVSESIGNAVSLIGANKHTNGEFEERFREEFEEHLTNESLDEIYGDETKGPKDQS
ncbi:MAG: hypothetical protein L6R38_005370 [Xanthoria sp. 2 TBL-2021]|nr:MAG: hypothetical protein L6R38_005370 [Xanthoria sp. 2 TBL-2021]